jgi:hypothetical protein
MTEGPKRLSQTETGELGKSLEQAKRSVMPAERLNRLAERLAQAGIVVPGTPPSLGSGPSAHAPEPAATAKAPSTNALWVKAALGVVGAGGALLAVVMATQTPEPAATTSARPSARAPSDDLRPPAVEAPAVAQPRPPSRGPGVLPREAKPVPQAESAAPAVPLPSLIPPAAAPRARPPTTATEAPLAAPRSESARQPPAGAALAPPSTESPRAAASSADVSSDPRPEPAAAPPRSEVELLKEARDSIASDPQRALLLTRRHRAEFPFGAYSQERDFLAVSALSRLGRAAEARSLAESFRRRYPRSAYLPQLARLLGDR